MRHQIDVALQRKGWILEASNVRRNVFFEASVKSRIPNLMARKLGGKRPDYTLFNGARPLAVIEAKKPSIINLENALDQARDYARKLDAKIVFACNGTTIKSQFIDNESPLYLNGAEVSDFLPPKTLSLFQSEESNEVITVSDEIIRSRSELIQLFSELNNDLRSSGIRAGIERFNEFANILFLKLLSEQNDQTIWNELLRLDESRLLGYLNNVAMKQLRDQYGGNVISDSQITKGRTLQNIVQKLNPLRLTSIDEDVKGVAFEHFIQKTTDTQNDLGEYFTPRHIVRFMVRLLNPKFEQTVYDPFCGTGGFLTESFRHIRQQCSNTHHNNDVLMKQTLFGKEISKTARIAKMNMILFGDGHSGIEQQNSLEADSSDQYDNILSNIPFSQTIDENTLNSIADNPKDADEACVLKCFQSLKTGGSMAIVIPEGLIVNQNRKPFWKFLCQNARIRALIHLPRGCFAPYTEAKTGILYLTDKMTSKTKWFYHITVENDGFDSNRNPVPGINDLEKTLFFYQDSSEPQNNFPEGLAVHIIHPDNGGFVLHSPWEVDDSVEYTELEQVADIRSGTSITERNAIAGNIPVIAGGQGTIPYYHNRSNSPPRVFTISKSGAYSGYVWWHDIPIWASDSLVVKSKDESKYLTRYLFMCMVLKQEEIYKRQKGTGQPHVYRSSIVDFPIPVMSVEKQTDLLKRYETAQKKKRSIDQEVQKEETSVRENLMRYYGDS